MKACVDVISGLGAVASCTNSGFDLGVIIACKEAIVRVRSGSSSVMQL